MPDRSVRQHHSRNLQQGGVAFCLADRFLIRDLRHLLQGRKFFDCLKRHKRITFYPFRLQLFPDTLRRHSEKLRQLLHIRTAILIHLSRHKPHLRRRALPRENHTVAVKNTAPLCFFHRYPDLFPRSQIRKNHIVIPCQPVRSVFLQRKHRLSGKGKLPRNRLHFHFKRYPAHLLRNVLRLRDLNLHIRRTDRLINMLISGCKFSRGN